MGGVYPRTPPSTIASPTFRLLLDRYLGRVAQLNRDRGARRKGRRISATGYNGGRSGAGANRPTDSRAFGAAEDAAEDGAADCANANLGRALAAGGVAFTVDRLSLNRQRAVCQHDRREADAEPRAIAHLAAALDEDHLSARFRAGRNHDPVADLHIARHPCDHLVFDTGGLAAHGRLDLQPDH